MNRMQLIAKTLVASVAVVGLGAVLSAPACASPVDDPCPLAMSLICHFVPIAPDLDHDVDLTTPPSPGDPTEPPEESLPPVDLCARGCS
jgi:hypothetical protein